MDGGSVDRRDFLRASIATAVAGVGGCVGTDGGEGTDPDTVSRDTNGETTSTPDTPATTETTTPGDDKRVFFRDDWEDGDYDTDPSWNIYSQGDNTYEVVERSTPRGGSNVLRVADATSSEVSCHSRPLGENGEWQGGWVIDGLFYAADVPGAGSDDPDCTYHDVWVAASREAVFKLTAYDPYDQQFEPIRIDGNRIETTDPASGGIEQGAWYRYSFRHDGNGGYRGSRWRAAESRSDGVTVTAGGAPPRNRNTLTLYTSGTSSEGLCQRSRAVVEHDFVEMRLQ